MDNIIKKHILKEYNQEPIFDGIVSPKDYESAESKILWILKEPNSSNETWDIRERIKTLREDDRIASGFEKTFKKIVYVTNAILKNIPWSANGIADNPTMIDELKKIAYINVKKAGGKSKSNRTDLAKDYLKSKQILKTQIENINPDILIFGGTFYLFKEDLNLPKMNEYGTCHSQSKNGQIFLDVYHPQYFTIEVEPYVKDIMLALENEKKVNGKIGN